MGSGRILACAVLLATACAIDIEDAVTLSQSRYDISIINSITNVGDNLTNIVVQYNNSYVSSIQHTSYSLYGGARIYINIDSTGTVTLKQKPRLNSRYTITFSVLVTAVPVSGNGTVPVYLSGQLILRTVGLVRFNSSSILGVMNAYIPINSVVYNLTDNTVVSTNYISSYTLSFSAFSSYYSIAHNGIVTTRRSLAPGRYSVRVRMDYTVTFKNGTLSTATIYITFTATARGCSSREEATLEWPTMGTCQVAQHTCSKFHPFLQGGFIGSYCTTGGTPSFPDYSRCCVTSNRTNPFAVVWLTYSGVSVSTYVSRASAIGNGVKGLFPRGIATSVNLYSIYRSNKYYGVSMSYNVQLSASVTLTQIQAALRVLKSSRRFGGFYYLRYESASRGIRAFRPSSCCAPYSYGLDDGTLSFILVPYCCGSGTNYGPCGCSSTRSCSPSSYAARSCSQCRTSDIMHPELSSCPNVTQSTPAPPPAANESCVRFNASSYSGNVYLGNANRGVKILTVGMEACSDKHIKQYSVKYALNGYLSDYFDIGKPTGEITLSGVPVIVRLYLFTVSAFVDITYKSGAKVQNFTETSVRIQVHGGVTLNQTQYRFDIPADTSTNQSILNLSKEVVVDRTIVSKLLSITFTRVSSTRFGVTSDGNLFLRTKLVINGYNYGTVYYTYVILDVNQQQKTFSGTVSIRVVATGCRQEEGGSYVWPVTHPCGAIKVPCHHYDSSFEMYGNVRRQCTKDGNWLQPDFSQCRLKYGSKPFLLVWFTFSSVFTRHWNDIYTPRTIGELQTYVSGFPTTKITIHHNKESKVVYGFVQSFKIDLRSGTNLNGTRLLLLQNRIIAATRIGGRGKSRLNYTAGVLGFSTSDRCLQFDTESTVANYAPVCVMRDRTNTSCQCKRDTMLSLSPCCTARGTLDRTKDTCGTTLPAIDPIVVKATVSITLKLAGKGVQVSWLRSGGDAPSFYEVFYSSPEIMGYVKVPGTNSIYTIPRLLPGVIYTISVRGYYSNSFADSFSDSDTIRVPEMAVFKFQIVSAGVTNCADLKNNLGDVRSQLANTLRNGCQCSFNTDLLALIVHQCPYGKASDQLALMYGWIYDAPDQPGEKYYPPMQQMVGRATFTAGGQKLVATQICDVNKHGSECLPLQVPTNTGALSNGESGSTTAAIIVLIIVAIVACVLLAVILVILILKYKTKNQALKSNVALSSATVTLSETTKEVEGIGEDDCDELQKDF